MWKDPDAGKDWGQEEKRTTEDVMVGRHHRHNGHGFGWTPGVGDGQGGLACCDSWGCKESDTTEQLNWTDLRLGHVFLFQLKTPRWQSGKESACQCRRHKRCGFNPWVVKNPWRSKCQHPVFVLNQVPKSWTWLSANHIL